jgi:uridine kinase
MAKSLDELLQLITKQPPLNKKSYLISIDGPAGAGKTTLAARISSSWKQGKVHTIHMDDIYDGWENALTETLTRTLENQILRPLHLGKRASLRKFNWLTSSFGDFYQIPDANLYLLEGVGSAQKVTRKYLDQIIWIDIDQEVGLLRVLRRDGDYLENEMRIWQQRELSHFELENTRDCATFRFDGNFFI